MRLQLRTAGQGKICHLSFNTGAGTVPTGAGLKWAGSATLGDPNLLMDQEYFQGKGSICPSLFLSIFLVKIYCINLATVSKHYTM